jgi:hypothetical protein
MTTPASEPARWPVISVFTPEISRIICGREKAMSIMWRGIAGGCTGSGLPF